MCLCWYLYIYICILTRNSDSTGSDPPPLSSVRFLRVVRWARLRPSFWLISWHIVVLLAQVQNRGASSRRWELSPDLLLGFLCCLWSLLAFLSALRRKLWEKGAPLGTSNITKIDLALGVLLCRVSHWQTEVAGAGPSLR